MNKPQKISPEIWKSLSKSQKRLARKKMASEHLKSAVNAAVRRDNDFIARHTGSFSRKTGEVQMLKLTKEEKNAIRLVSTLEKESSRNNSWNIAEALAGNLENSRFESDVAIVRDAAKKFQTADEKIDQLKAGSSRKFALREITEKAQDIIRLFSEDSEQFDILNSNYRVALDAVKKLQLAVDESTTDKKQFSKLSAELQQAKGIAADIEKKLNDICKGKAIVL